MNGLLAGIAAVLLVAFVIDAVVRARRRGLRQSGLLPPEGQGTDADVERVLRQGHTIEAVKLYRAVHGVGLKDAKEAVDAMRDRLRRDGAPGPS